METEKSMKIMVTGAGGFVGSRLVAYYGKKYDVWGVTHKDLDLTDFDGDHLMARFNAPQWAPGCAASLCSGFGRGRMQ